MSWKLKDKLKKIFKDKLVFIEQRGKSDIVCSHEVTVGDDALCKASELNDLQIENTSDFVHFSDSALSDQNILHSAARVLRRNIWKIERTTQSYLPSHSMEKGYCMDFVPKDLYRFVSWLIDSNSFDDATESKDNFQAVSICHSIISSSLHTITPITLGLGVLLHHEYGSKKLINELYALGHCVSYDEVRRFLTSVALEQSHDDVYIAKGLKKVISY